RFIVSRPGAMPYYQLLAVDIDGTLLDSRLRLTEATRLALGQLRHAGVRVVLVTGRRYARTLAYVEALKLDVPVVTVSGALIKHPAERHRTLHASNFDRDVLINALDVLVAGGHEPILYGDTYTDGFDFYCRSLKPNEPNAATFMAQNPTQGRVWANMQHDPPPGIVTGLAVGDKPAMQRLAAELEERLPGAMYIHVLRSPLFNCYMCEFAPITATKWSGVLRLASQWGIAPERIAAVGDDVNDIPMIAQAGLGVAMGNALPEVLAVAKRVAPSHDEDGLVAVVEWLLAAEEPLASDSAAPLPSPTPHVSAPPAFSPANAGTTDGAGSPARS
ncbi:MAG TPA: HAD family hydrolase, partial [Pirellulales bacterium]